jgi:hypothetical protein
MTPPFDLGFMKWRFQKLREGYDKADTDRKRRLCVREYIALLVDLASAVNLGDDLGPVVLFLRDLADIERGHRITMLEPHGGKPAAPLIDIKARAHLAAAAEFFYRDNKAGGRRLAAQNTLKTAKIHGLKWNAIDDWRKKFAAGDSRNDFGAWLYHWLTTPEDPEADPIPGHAEIGPLSNRQYAIWLIKRARSMGYLG